MNLTEVTSDSASTLSGTFVEVKTHLNFAKQNFGGPEEKVDFQKQRKLIKLAENWLREKKISFESKWQIDIIGIVINKDSKKAKIQHFKNVAAD